MSQRRNSDNLSLRNRKTPPLRTLSAVLILAIAASCSTGRTEIAENLPESPLTAPSGNEPQETAVRNTVETILNSMTLREKLAQRFIIWIPGFLDDGGLAELKAMEPGGYIFFPWNYSEATDVRRLAAELSDAPAAGDTGWTITPFLSADLEGGRVSAFRFPEFPSLPSPFRLGSLGDPVMVELTGGIAGATLANLGLNMNLAPVADLYPVGDSTIIGDRSFGPDPDSTSESVMAFSRGLAEWGIIPTLKHFPGHGITTVDSHGRLPVAGASVEELRRGHLRPFAAGIAAGAPVVMTAHILYPSIDPVNPATLSRVILQKLLREEMGFDGIILSDGFEMGAIADTFEVNESLARAFEAGVDQILLYSRYDPKTMIDTAENLVRSGRISEGSVDESVRRILKVKERYNLLRSVSASVLR